MLVFDQKNILTQNILAQCSSQVNPTQGKSQLSFYDGQWLGKSQAEMPRYFSHPQKHIFFGISRILNSLRKTTTYIYNQRRPFRGFPALSALPRNYSYKSTLAIQFNWAPVFIIYICPIFLNFRNFYFLYFLY